MITTDCSNIQILGGTTDKTLDESGSVILTPNQSEVSVTFTMPKVTAAYHFEYLYVDDLTGFNAGIISVVPIIQTAYGFSVELAGAPIGEGYILRWRVVIDSVSQFPVVGAPENIRVQLPFHIGDQPVINILTVMFANPRADTEYGFSELRVENLVEPPEEQVPVLVQVYDKQIGFFRIAFTPDLVTPNYYLIARTP